MDGWARVKQRAVDPRTGHDTEPAADDASIIGRSLAEPELFTHVYERHAADIHAYIARRLGPEVAEDLLAETFVLAFEKRARFDRARGAVRPWLYGIATNVVARHRRTEARRLHALARAAARPEPGGGWELADAVADRLSAAGLRGELMAALAAMPGRNRDVLLLMAWGGLSHEEVARSLGLRPGAVRTRLHRARRSLREALEGIDTTGEEW